MASIAAKDKFTSRRLFQDSVLGYTLIERSISMDGIVLIVIGCLVAVFAIPRGGFGERIRHRASKGELRAWRILVLTISAILMLAGITQLLIHFQAP